MSDFTIRADSVNVEQIMEQIRSRIREKRGVDYTEEQIRELAQVKLEKILDPSGVRSDLLEAFRRHRPPYEVPTAPLFVFEDTTLFESRNAAVRFFRNLLKPVLKLFLNVNVLIHTLHNQAAINKASLDREVAREARRHELDGLYFEVIHNLVFELTRLGIEAKNLKMRVESLSSRVDFNERRARALEGVVVYRPSSEERVPVHPVEPAAQEREAPHEEASSGGRPAEGPGQRSRRRRRRRGRRGSAPAASIMGAGSASEADAGAPTPETSAPAPPPAAETSTGEASGDAGASGEGASTPATGDREQ